ncbi:molybdenum cofactor guanylyltransferase [Haloparvum alkalitolerans]|uniref:molybdenum cofactor guanylyltransferase n=1 Tax=Haloparvum alkalitolerans TaxID=1042953 RepID=UPI003CEB0D1D
MTERDGDRRVAARPSPPKPDTGIAGVVLAGGRSRRFPPGDKALATLDGRPLVAHAVDALLPAVDEVVVNCRADQRAALADALDPLLTRFAVDDREDAGPVAGLAAALSATEARYAAVLPCDRPAVGTALLARLLSAVRGESGAVPRFDGRRQPFPLVVHVRVGRSTSRRMLDAGASLASLLAELDPVEVPETEVRALAPATAFTDVDDPADLRRLEALSAADAPARGRR